MAILIVPGLNGSPPTHWQSHWERAEPGARRVEQDDWHQPALGPWSERLIDAIERNPGAVLVAHSLGCALVAGVAEARPDLAVSGAFLVAPADVDPGTCAHAALEEFAPMPLGRLRFPTTVVASSNDAFMAIERARVVAGAWGARFVDIGACGHINVDAGFGPWPAGLRMLRSFVDDLTPARPRERIAAAAG
jgi:predicted alpha/beta hydrolase family esterase